VLADGGVGERRAGVRAKRGGRGKHTVSDEAAEVSADYAVPSRTFPLIKLRGYLLRLFYHGAGGGESTVFLMYCAMSWWGVVSLFLRGRWGY
jgi:hypothetical protein